MSFLPGHFPCGSAAARSVLTTLTQVASATSANSTNVTGPATIVAGDLLVLWDIASGLGAAPAAAVPSGFNTAVTGTGTGLSGGVAGARCIISWKIATGAEASAALAGMPTGGGGTFTAKELYVFRGNIPITTATANDTATQLTDGNPTAQVVNASGGVVPLVVIAGYSTGSGTLDPRTFSPAKDGEINADTRNYLAYKIYNASPADVTADMDDEGSIEILASCYITCA